MKYLAKTKNFILMAKGKKSGEEDELSAKIATNTKDERATNTRTKELK